MTTTNGLLLIDKPQGLTSHDVVARVRKILNERKVGHAGTLDPMATGLLVMAVGPSTRLLRFAQSQVKRYSGTVCFGIATDSLDADGAVLETRAVPELEPAEVLTTARAMLGPQQQIPPMVSALKVDGRRLHSLAREGIEVERAPRDITVTRFDIQPTSDPSRWDFDVECTVGTYVRVLLSDLALRLGTIGHLVALRREASGNHTVTDAVTLDELDARVARGEVVLAPPVAFVGDLEHLVFSPDQVVAVRRGQRIPATADVPGEVAVLDEKGALVAIVHRRTDTWQPDLVFPESA